MTEPIVIVNCPAVLHRAARSPQERAPRRRAVSYCPVGLAAQRTPALLLHGNRLSCALPEAVGAERGASVRSLVLMGSMLGDGAARLPSWVSEEEQQQGVLSPRNL